MHVQDALPLQSLWTGLAVFAINRNECRNVGCGQESQRFFLHSLESCKAYNRLELSAWRCKWLVIYSKPCSPGYHVSRASCRIIAGFASARLGSRFQERPRTTWEGNDTSQPRRTHHQPKARPTLPALRHQTLSPPAPASTPAAPHSRATRLPSATSLSAAPLSPVAPPSPA